MAFCVVGSTYYADAVGLMRSEEDSATATAC